MSGMVQTITLDHARAGMVLAADLCDGGKVLLPAGASLSEASLMSLRRRDIACLTVVGEDAVPADQAALLAGRERQCVRLGHLFRNSAGVGASAHLLALLLDYRRSG